MVDFSNQVALVTGGTSGIGLACARAFVDAAVLSGKIPRPDYAVEWTTPKWDYVNPMQDVEADALEVVTIVGGGA